MKLPPIVFAFAFAAVLAWRWRRLGWSVKLAGAVMSAAPALHGAGVFHPPELETVIGDLGSALAPYTYALVAVMAFLETGAFVGPLVPGETVVIVGGVVASQGHIDLVAVVGLTWNLRVCGRRHGLCPGSPARRRFLLEHGPRVHVTEPRVIRVEAFFARYGLATILIGKFVGPGPADRAVPGPARLEIPSPPVRRARARRHRPVGHCVRAPGLRVLAIARRGCRDRPAAARWLGGHAPPRGRLPPAARPGGSTDRPITAQLQRDRC